jgi:hypothetical protein
VRAAVSPARIAVEPERVFDSKRGSAELFGSWYLVATVSAFLTVGPLSDGKSRRSIRERLTVAIEEMAHAKAMAETAKAAGLQHVIWSTLEDTRKWVPLNDDRMPTLQGKYKVPHFDGKGESDHLFADAGVPTTFLLTSFYWDNFIYFGMGPKKGPDGKLAITFPTGDKKLPGIAVEDIGKCTYGIFSKGKEFIGKTVAISGENLTGAQLAALFTEVLAREVRYNSVPPDVYRGFGFPGADDLGNMFQFKRDFEEYFCGVRSPDFARGLNPSLQNFKTWLLLNQSAIPHEEAVASAS